MKPTADSEDIDVADLEAIKKAIADVADISGISNRYENQETGLYLWCARKRGMRPQGCAYPENRNVWPLFDACGPERESGIGCSNKRPEN